MEIFIAEKINKISIELYSNSNAVTFRPTHINDKCRSVELVELIINIKWFEDSTE